MAKGQVASGGNAGVVSKTQQHTATSSGGSKGGPAGRGGRGRNVSGTGPGRGGGGQQPGNSGKGASNTKAQQAAAAVPLSIASRYQKPGGGRGFGGPPQVDVLTPTVPPLYPTAPKPSPLNLQVNDRVAVYKRFCQYYSSNYGVHLPRRAKCGFNVDRFTDRYKAPLTVNPDIVHRLGSQRLPEELNSTSAKLVIRKIRAPRVPMRRRAVEDLPDEDQKDGELRIKKPRIADEDNSAAPPNDLIDEDEMEEADEELDMGTDYLSNYFDNGEEFLDGENDTIDEDGPTF